MTTIHPLLPEDAPVVAAMRLATEAHKGEHVGPEARSMFDAMLASTPAASGIQVAPGVVGGTPGIWCRPINSMSGARILFLHGGGYVLGSAAAYANFSGQIAARVGVETFVTDYRRAPEHPFPAAIDDAVAAYRGLVANGIEKIAIVGDSAGGGLTLSLLSILAAERPLGTLQPVAAAVMSPWTDLTLSGPSMKSRAKADPIFTRGVLQVFADFYLQGRDASTPMVSPLFARLSGLPPIRIDVGDDEILLDDAILYAERARVAGVNATLAVWTGMPHVFQSSLGRLRAAEQSMNHIGQFLRDAICEKGTKGYR